MNACQSEWRAAPELRQLIAHTWPREYANAKRGIPCVIPLYDGSKIRLRSAEPVIEIDAPDIVAPLLQDDLNQRGDA